MIPYDEFLMASSICLFPQGSLVIDIVKVDLLAFQKISKRHFLRGIEKSFQEVTPIGPEPHIFSKYVNK